MSDAIKKLHDYLAKSPSVVYPENVLAYLPAIEAENAALRELVRDMWPSYCYANSGCETFLTDEQDVAIRERVHRLKVINK